MYRVIDEKGHLLATKKTLGDALTICINTPRSKIKNKRGRIIFCEKIGWAKCSENLCLFDLLHRKRE